MNAKAAMKYELTRRILNNPKKREEIDMPDPDGNTWLIDASRENNVDLVLLLLQNGADPWRENHASENALTVADNEGSTDVASIIRDYMEFVNQESVLQELPGVA
tara:strand:+ start:206 stop:520 length:315 start_codon:yes stop_codon:yes gene_type:complete